MKSEMIELLMHRQFLLEQELSKLQAELTQLRDDCEKLNKDSHKIFEAAKKVISKHNITAKTRIPMVALKRHFVRSFLKENTKIGLLRIAQLTGATHHSTVINSLKVHRNLVEIKDKEYLTIVEELTKEIKELS